MDPDPTSFFIDLKDANFFSYYVLEIAYRHIIFSLKILFCMQYFSPLNIFMRKGKDPEPGPEP